MGVLNDSYLNSDVDVEDDEGPGPTGGYLMVIHVAYLVFS